MRRFIMGLVDRVNAKRYSSREALGFIVFLIVINFIVDSWAALLVIVLFFLINFLAALFNHQGY